MAKPLEDHHLFASRFGGSAIVEAALALGRIHYRRTHIDFKALGPDCERLKAINPLGQVPTLVCPDGSVLSESAAIILYVDRLTPEAGLVPEVDNPSRDRFFRWLIFFAASIYPTFTYGDFPERWVTGKAAQKELLEKTDARRKELWLFLEQNVAAAPWFLGDVFSAADLYISVMTHWRPRRAWFAEHCPKLTATALEVDALLPLKEIWSWNFDAGPAAP